jgi:fatty-acid desaturase
VGLHRGIIHRSFRMHRLTRRLLAWLFVLVGLGGPLRWIRAHNQRDHWQNLASAPPWFRYDHGILQDAVWNLLTAYVDSTDDLVPDDDRRDPWLRWLERTWVLHVLGSFALLATLGWEHVVVGGFLRVWAAQVAHGYIGYEAHARGELRWVVPGAIECGRNRWALGVLSLGEGFHNNHHAFPGSARLGHRWYELDAGWVVIRAMAAVGLAWDVVAPEGAARTGIHPAAPVPLADGG